jgi:hypothetical protein
MMETYIIGVILWLVALFSLTSGIVFVVYSLNGGANEVVNPDRSRANNRRNLFLGVGDAKDG